MLKIEVGLIVKILKFAKCSVGRSLTKWRRFYNFHCNRNSNINGIQSFEVQALSRENGNGLLNGLLTVHNGNYSS